MMEVIKKFLRKHWPTLVGIVVGTIGGYLYWRFIGCATGSCPITSSPLNSSIFGAIFGGLIFNTFTKRKIEK